MKNNLQEQLQWLQNEYYFEKDPVIVRAKQAAQIGFQSTTDSKNETGKPVNYSSNAYSSLQANRQTKLNHIPDILGYAHFEEPQKSVENANFTPVKGPQSRDIQDIASDQFYGLSEGFFEVENVGNFLPPATTVSDTKSHILHDIDGPMVANDENPHRHEASEDFGDFEDFMLEEEEPVEPLIIQQQYLEPRNSCTPPYITAPADNEPTFCNSSSSRAIDQAEQMNQLLQEKTKVSMEICDLMERFDTATGLEMHDLSQKLGELRQRRKDIDSKMNCLKTVPEAPASRSNQVQVPLVSVPVQKSGNDQLIFDNQSSEWDQRNFPWTRNIKKAMKHVFKLRSFRSNQLNAINGTMSGRDVFVLMPTGGGKSLCYQLPAVISKGITIVVSPLLSLIQDQIQNLMSRGIIALTISSSQSDVERNFAFAELSRDKPICKLFYVTPEMIVRSRQFQEALDKLNSRQMLARFVIDEAHCLSAWGHDFRPDYKELNFLKSKYSVPIMALTATATNRVQMDILHNLNIQSCLKFSQSFNRPNLRYCVYRKSKSVEFDIVSFINTYYHGKSGIIYCLSKKDCELMAEILKTKHKLNAYHYHAGMDARDRNAVQTRWAQNEIQIIVATIAFGMGIDKADVRFVIHYSLPKSLEGYYQETGRAGRDGRPATCVLYYTYADKGRIEFMLDKSEGSFEQKQTQRDNLREVIQYCENKIDCRRSLILRYFGENFDRQLCAKSCDNCETQKNVKTVDMTSKAREVLALMGSLRRSDLITLNHLIDIYRGSGAKRISQYKHLPNAGKGKSLGRGEVERLIQHLCTKQVLMEFNVHNKMGFVSSYVKIGPMARQLETGVLKIVLMTCDEDTTANAPTTSSSNKVAATWPSRKRALEDKASGPTVSKTIKAASKRKEREDTKAKPVSSKSHGTSPLVLNMDCFDELMRKRAEVCTKENIQCHHFLSNAAIGELAKRLPQNLQELKAIKGIEERQLMRFGPAFLEVCRKYPTSK